MAIEADTPTPVYTLPPSEHDPYVPAFDK